LLGGVEVHDQSPCVMGDAPWHHDDLSAQALAVCAMWARQARPMVRGGSG